MIVDAAWRGRSVGRSLVEAVLHHERLRAAYAASAQRPPQRRIDLYCRENVLAFYRDKFGFRDMRGAINSKWLLRWTDPGDGNDNSAAAAAVCNEQGTN